MDDTNRTSSELISSFRDALNLQVQSAIARRIRAKVRDARNDVDQSAKRWPFELIQNAHDAGERVGADGISVSFEFKDGLLFFEHDAAPFEMDDVAALLTGGSSKDFDAVETTGRFGTGFLVTHVLSSSVNVEGVLQIGEDFRLFDVFLDRPDDEALILRNLEEAENALGRTRQLAKSWNNPTAKLRYVVDDEEAVLAGLDMLEGSLPHLFGSCRRLSKISITRGSKRSLYRRQTAPEEPAECNGLWIDEVLVSKEDGESGAEWRIVRAATAATSDGWILLALRRVGDKWACCRPRAASVFRQLPVVGGPSLPAWIVLDGRFDLDQERRVVHVSDDQAKPLRQAFAALGDLALMASREGWVDALRIAHLAMPEGPGEHASKVWREILGATVTELANLPIVQTVHAGALPAVETDGYDHWADFVTKPICGLTYSELWELAAQCTQADVPVASEAEGWSEIAKGWEALGIEVTQIDLDKVGKRAACDSENISALHVSGNPFDWLAQYLNCIGKVWQESGITKGSVEGLLPDQHGRLRDFGELQIDKAVSDDTKEIAAQVGLDLRRRLLHESLVHLLEDRGLEFGRWAIQECTDGDFEESEGLRMVGEHLSAMLPEDEPVAEDRLPLISSSISFLKHLWASMGDSGKELAWTVPLMVADGSIRRPGTRRTMAPPVASWPEAAQPFSSAYPPQRVLANEYATTEDSEALLKALAAWGISHLSLIEQSKRDELRDRALRAILVDRDMALEGRLKAVEMSQIALLEPEVLNYCKQSRDRARSLLGLVIRYAAPEDTSWRLTDRVLVQTSTGAIEIDITPCLWLSDLRSKPWIPVECEEDVTHHAASPELLRDLLDPAWLESNQPGADLLVQHFDMDALDVQLMVAARDEEARQRLRDGLARIIDAAGRDLEAFEELVARAEQRKKDVRRMRALGLAVQKSVIRTLRGLGLKVADVDHGYDVLVSDVSVFGNDTDDLSVSFDVNQYKVEIKATSTDEARLTPLQAATAAEEPDIFVLCVVDLKDFGEHVHDVDWAEADVSHQCRFVPGNQLPIDDSLSLIRNAEKSDVPIRNSTALRYAVPRGIWMPGLELDDWVRAAFSRE